MASTANIENSRQVGASRSPHSHQLIYTLYNCRRSPRATWSPEVVSCAEKEHASSCYLNQTDIARLLSIYIGTVLNPVYTERLVFAPLQPLGIFLDVSRVHLS
jgi:hypothetical protein